MKTWEVSGTVTISIFTRVEAETEEDARAIAEGRECGSMAIHAFTETEHTAWITGELDGIPRVERVREQ